MMPSVKCARYFAECRDHKFWKAVRCEFLCSMIYILFGCGALSHIQHTTFTHPHNNETADIHSGFSAMDTLTIASSFGLCAAILVAFVGRISGALCNPAVTLSMLVTRNISVVRTVIYMVAQLLGAMSGAGVLYALSSEQAVKLGHLGAIYPDSSLTPAQVFGIEFMAALLVTIATLSSPDDSKAFCVGCSVVAAHLFSVPSTGCGLNPFRCLAPAAFSGVWKMHWVYWVGPLLGGVIGGFTYEYSKPPSSITQETCDQSVLSIETCATQLTV